MAKKKITKPEENLDNHEQQNTLKVEIISNKSLFDILGETRRVWKIVLVLFILVFTIFVALAFVTIAIKRIYPYNDIKINALGAMTMQNEDKEVIYWLFNTADLWANSGIKVKKGDILTIRASGRSHTAIHHLVNDAQENKVLDDKWVSTDGEGKLEGDRDKLRAQYRIFKNKAQDALLMQVIPEQEPYFLKINPKEGDRRDRIAKDSYLIFEYIDTTGFDKAEQNYLRDKLQKRENFYFIGKEREDLLIHNDGILHFAVNAIVLTDSVIKVMKKFAKEYKNNPIKDGGLKFGNYPQQKNNVSDTTKTEMDYYDEKNYYNAWYDDNVVSFLIVIERKRSK
jgi:hypothetical protein